MLIFHFLWEQEGTLHGKTCLQANKTVLSRSGLFIHRMKSERFKPASLNSSRNNCSAMLLNSKRGHWEVNEQSSLVQVCPYLFTDNEIQGSQNIMQPSGTGLLGFSSKSLFNWCNSLWQLLQGWILEGPVYLSMPAVVIWNYKRSAALLITGLVLAFPCIWL